MLLEEDSNGNLFLLALSSLQVTSGAAKCELHFMSCDDFIQSVEGLLTYTSSFDLQLQCARVLRRLAALRTSRMRN
jgi:hypothetical protein